MDAAKLAHFKQKLVAARGELEREMRAIDAIAPGEAETEGDQSDHASAETDRDIIELNRARVARMLEDVDHALARIAAGGYGICADTGEPIELSRLEAQPTATLSLAAQQRRERTI